MIFEKLANAIYKHSKLIVAIWIVALICSVPLALKASEVLDYDTSNMAGPDAESIRGTEIIGEYFHPSEIQMESAVILIASFETDEGNKKTEEMDSILAEAFNKDYRDDNEKKKVKSFEIFGMFPNISATEGIAMYLIVYDDEMIEKGLVSDDTQNLRDFIHKTLGDADETFESILTLYVTGSPAITFDTKATAMNDVSKIDVFAILMILVLVGLFFRSFISSAMPPMTIGAAFGIVLCLMYLIGSVINVFFITQMLLLVSMLGAGCDYCIFILARYREERVNGKEHEVAAKSAITWAGESITTSGIAVIIGFGAMSICSFSMISSLGIMLAIGIAIALLAALTLISSLLVLFGDKLFWPTKPETLREGGKALKGWYGKVSGFGHRYFVKSAHASIKYAKPIIVAAILFTIPMAYVMATSESSYDMIGAMSAGESMEGMDKAEEYTNGGMIMPNYAILELENPIGTIVEMQNGLGMLSWNPEYSNNYLTKLSTLSSEFEKEDNVGEIWGIYQWGPLAEEAAKSITKGTMDEKSYTELVYYIATLTLPETLSKMTILSMLDIVEGYFSFNPSATYNDPILIGMMDYVVNYVMATSVGGEAEGAVTNLTHVKYTVITKDEAMADRSMETVKYLDHTLSEFVSENKDLFAEEWLTGGAVVMYEVSELVSDEFLKVEILAILLIFVLLFLVMKSYVTPLRSILTILMSVIWTVAITHLVFGNILDVGVMWMLPILLLVVCLGLGMDYDILLTTRIKENRIHKGLSNDDAITYAVTHSGSVITICGLIMGGAFGTLMLSSTLLLQQFGFALCFAILVDALIVRTYIVPAAMHLLGEWNWKGPKFMQKNNPQKPPE